MRAFIFFLLLNGFLASAQSKNTLPPYTGIVASDMYVNEDNFGTSYHFWPLNWYEEGYPVKYNTTPGDYRNRNPFGSDNLEILDQYKVATWFRNFYPNDIALWNSTDGLSLNTLAWFLKELDFHYTNKKKYLWAAELFDTQVPKFGVQCNTEQYEKNLTDFLTQLFTCNIKSELGFTIASHPALAAVELANEQTTSSTAYSDYNNAYARFVRIVHDMFKKYKPSCQIITFSAMGGNGDNFQKMLNGNAQSLINSKIGNGKKAADYLDGLTWHFYQVNVETDTEYSKDIRNNGFSSRNTIHISEKNMLGALRDERDNNPKSPLYKSNLKKLVIWNTESGVAPMETVNAYDGGFRWFKMDRKKRFEALIKWFIPTLFETQNGKGGLGVTWAYKSDLPGVPYVDYPGGSKGFLLDIRKGNEGKIRFNASKKASKGWLNNMSIVITAPTSGWDDLGLKKGEKKRFEVTVIDRNQKVLEIQESTFHEKPINVPTYTEYQLAHSPYPEEFKEMIELLKSGPVTFGWIHYPNHNYEGIYIEVKNIGKWYTTEKGELRNWK